ncbi:MAG: carboxypeptidase regulatory-like domain-containing protein [Cryomorphaceae bacterium]|nr:MAG: carboxypeptidase regulatory-like domain-containing protein [Cryomorphaceae bacterium]
MNFRISLFIGAALLFVLASCKKEEPNGVTTPASKLRGKVELYDKWGNIVITGRAGTQAFLTGQFQNFQTTTDNTGRFEFNDLPDGTYTVSVSREGYATGQIANILFSKNSPTLAVQGEYQLLPTINLGVASTAEVDSTEFMVFYETQIIYIDTINEPWETDIDTVSANLYLRSVIGPVTPVPNAKAGYRIFLGKTPNTSPSNYLRTIHGVVNINQTNPQAGVVEIIWNQQQWSNLGFNKGDVVYARIYGDAVNPILFESPGGQTIFPTLSDEFGAGMDMIANF